MHVMFRFQSKRPQSQQPPQLQQQNSPTSTQIAPRREDSLLLDDELRADLRRASLTEEEIDVLINSFEDAKCCDDPPLSPPASVSPPESPSSVPKAVIVAEKLKQMIDETKTHTSITEAHTKEMYLSTKDWLQGTTNRCQFDENVFPPELMLSIFTYLDFRSLCRSAQVCRYWRALASDKGLWFNLCVRIGLDIERVPKENATAAQRDPYVAFLMAFKSGQLVDEPFGKSTVLTMSFAKHLHSNLPKRWGPGSTLVPLFATSQHGWSFSALHSNVAKQRDGPTLIVIKDENDWVFGCYASTQWRRASMDYYGTSECFLFQLFPYVKFYHHTHECSNTNFMLSDPTGLYVGGYADFPGLHIASDMLHGCSRQTTTFRSKPLCANLDGEFKIKGIEVYGIKGAEEATIFPVDIQFGYSARDGAGVMMDLTSRVITHYG